MLILAETSTTVLLNYLRKSLAQTGCKDGTKAQFDFVCKSPQIVSSGRRTDAFGKRISTDSLS